MENRKGLLSKITEIESIVNNNKANICSELPEINIQKTFCCDKSAVEDYKNLKSEINSLDLDSRPVQLAYLPVKVNENYKKR